MSEDLAKGLGLFIVLKIRPQLESYLNKGTLPELMETFASLKRSCVTGSTHDDILEAGHLDLTIGCDAGPITNVSQISALPIVLLINNIPVCYQSRFPVLAALHTGTYASKPPMRLFFDEVKNELRELSTSPIIWKRSSTDGSFRSTKVFVTISQSDAPQWADLLNLKAHSGTFSCPLCFIKGNTINGKPKFPGIILHANQRHMPRSEATQLMLARDVCEAMERNPGRAITMKGVKGFPVIYKMPHFDTIFSHTPDSLHVIFKGIMKRIMNDLCGIGTVERKRSIKTSVDDGFTSK